MATSVPVDERTRDRLERLQETVERETGRTVTQQELLARVVDREFEDRESLVDSFRAADAGGTGVDSSREPLDHVDVSDDGFEGLSEDEKERWLSGTSDWGFETTEEEVDEVLYGSPDEFSGDTGP